MDVRVGFIGAGAVARRHAHTLMALGGVRIVGVTDVTASAARELAAVSGATIHPDPDALLAAGVDAVYVCVPPFAHGDLEAQVLDAGAAVFVEKPIALDVETGERVAAAIAASGAIAATGYHWRYLEGVERAREALARTPARLAVGTWLDKVPPPAWWRRRALSGGQTVEQATHLVDLMLELLGDATSVYAVGSHAPRAAFPDADVDDVAAGVLRFASGAVGSVAATSLLDAPVRIGAELVGDGVRIEITEAAFSIQDGHGRIAREDGGRAKLRVDRDFVDAVRGGENRVRAPYDAALRTHRVACALARSAAEGRPVELTGAPAR